MPKDYKKSQIIIYKSEDGQTKIDVRFDGDTVWLSQDKIAELFGVNRPAISKHINNIFEDEELSKKQVCSILERTAADGKKYKTNFYNLDLIIAVGYRVSSKRATQFRIWATQVLREFIVKGFVMDDERLKNPDLPFDYFEELAKRIQDIRTSEKRFYRKITDIYATSVDYDPRDIRSVNFFKTVQNKVHFAITGSTAAEIVANRIDSNKKDIGLTNFRGKRPSKEEILVAKNYLNEKELLELNNLIEQYLIFAEGQALRHVPMYMDDWIEKLNAFLNLNDRDILVNAGKISHELAKEIAIKEFEKYSKKKLNQSSKADLDFDQFVSSTTKVLGKVKKNKNDKI